jgi:integrase
MANVVPMQPAPTHVLCDVTTPPRGGRPTNVQCGRTREYLTPAEVEALIRAAKTKGRRYPQRDALIVLMAARHGLRVSELADMRWTDIDLKTSRLLVRRKKGGISSTHMLNGDELRRLRALQREWPENGGFVFVTERKAPFTRFGLRSLIEQLGQLANLPFPVHFHMLRHAAGYRLVNEGRDTRSLQDYLGHVGIQHTVRYTRLSAERFKDW